MNRKIHKIHNMISCNFKCKTILFSESDFSKLAHCIFNELDSTTATSFVLAATRNTAIGISVKEYKHLEKLFCEKITPEIAKSVYGDTSMINIFHEFSDYNSRKYIEDYLEVYRYRNKIINFTIDEVDNGKFKDKVIRISNLKKQSFLDLILRRLGKELSSWNIILSSVKKISGSIFDLDFTVHTEDFEYKFNKNGVWRN